jgi:hypothetical protein
MVSSTIMEICHPLADMTTIRETSIFYPTQIAIFEALGFPTNARAKEWDTCPACNSAVLFAELLERHFHY